ncbi:hypothetical protein C922_03000 [Plasmodium inui San Antonio 1]|uniref:Uncharacterized protein n=1 Tax=Plasmodium inui San Antonio 1 TaxID=1237626 RepID=W7A4L3_9APIC|nr:hypothetical protein C922_03000 [Plasmodium inui San Antonio 1]EUD66675.1 hypothetical protein C922_03000 [Plasmodium inui San Antonio 1]
MDTKSNEDIDNKEDKNIEVKKKKKKRKKIIINVRKKVLPKGEVTIEDISSSNALGESLTDSRNGKGASRWKYVRRNSNPKEPSKAAKKARFFDQEYDIGEVRGGMRKKIKDKNKGFIYNCADIPNCPISEMLLKRKKKKMNNCTQDIFPTHTVMSSSKR